MVARVQGGSARTIGPSEVLTLSANPSYDENFDVTKDLSYLTYKWSCTIISQSKYGSDCSATLGDTSVTGESLVIYGLALDHQSVYAYTVLVSAKGSSTGAGGVRQASTSVSVQVREVEQVTGLPVGTFSSSFIGTNAIKFNRGGKKHTYEKCCTA